MIVTNFKQFLHLSTERLILRPLKIDDVNEILLLRSNEIVNRYLDREKTATIDEAKKFINKITNSIKANQSLYWAIALKGNDKLIGTICLYNISFEKNTAEIGYELHPNFHKKGFMQEAVAAIINLGFNGLQLKAITAIPRFDNTDSIKLLEKNYFKVDSHSVYTNEEENYIAYFLESNS